MRAIKNFSPALVVKSRRRCFSAALLGHRARTKFQHGGPGASIQGPTPPRQGASLFPANREAKREATKAWQAWPGNQTSSRSLVRSLVWPAGRGGGREAAQSDLRPPSRPLWWHWGKQSSRRPLETKKKKAQNGDISNRGNTLNSTHLLFWDQFLAFRRASRRKVRWGGGGGKFWVRLPRPERNGGVGSPARGTC